MDLPLYTNCVDEDLSSRTLSFSSFLLDSSQCRGLFFFLRFAACVGRRQRIPRAAHKGRLFFRQEGEDLQKKKGAGSIVLIGNKKKSK